MKLPEQKLYDLIPSQKTMNMMLSLSLHKNVIQIPTSVSVETKLDFDVLTRAFNEEIKRNDSLRIRFVKVKGEEKQYFLDEYHVDTVEVKHFENDEQMKAFFTSDAQKTVPVFKGVPYRIYFFDKTDGKSGIYFNVSHLVMDATACTVFYADMFKLYRALCDGTEMPKPLYKFEDYIPSQEAYLADKAKVKRDEDFYRDFWIKDGMPFYAGIHGPDILDREREKKNDPNIRIPAAYDMIHDKAELLTVKLDTERSKKIFKYCYENKVSPESILELGFRIHVMMLNHRTDDTFSLQLCSRRTTFKEKQMGGCLCMPIAVRAIIPADYTFNQGLNKLDEVKNTLYRHMNYPYYVSYAMEREIYHLSPFEAPSFMMFTWIPLPGSSEGMPKIEFDGYNMGRYCMPLYTFSYPDMNDMTIVFRFLYRVARISEEQLRVALENAADVIIQGIENGDKTIGELMDSIDPAK